MTRPAILSRDLGHGLGGGPSLVHWGWNVLAENDDAAEPCKADILAAGAPRRTQPPTQRLPVVAAPLIALVSASRAPTG
jgi:hypothetical protein